MFRKSGENRENYQQNLGKIFHLLLLILHPPLISKTIVNTVKTICLSWVISHRISSSS